MEHIQKVKLDFNANIVKMVCKSGNAMSMAEARRYVQGGIVTVNGNEIVDFNTKIEKGDIVQIGARSRFEVE